MQLRVRWIVALGAVLIVTAGWGVGRDLSVIAVSIGLLAVAGLYVERTLEHDLRSRAEAGVRRLDEHRQRFLDEQAASNEALRLAASVYQASSEGMIVTDASNHILSINPAFTRITGYSLGEVLGRDPRMLSAGRHGPLFWHQMWSAVRTRGTWQGEVWNRRKNGEVYAELLSVSVLRGPDGTVERHVGLFVDLSERKRSEDLIWEQANLDALTGLPNRRALDDRLDVELRVVPYGSGSVYCCLVDLDRFKEIRDGMGHERADRVLVGVAGRIRRCVPEAATVARLSADEFCVLIPNVTNRAEVDELARTILAAVAEPETVDGQAVHLSASMGIAAYPDDATDAGELLKHADQATYLAKKAGRARFSYFVPGLQRASQERLGLASDLRIALAGGQFALWYQPIIDLRTGRCDKVEALLRWHHPHRGLIGPADFIPLLEESGLIHEVGDWAFQEASRVAWGWSSRAGRAIRVGVNRSPVQFDEPRGPSWPDRLADWGIPGHLLAVEITEGLLLRDDPRIFEQIHALRAAGVHICIDDFGTGYSSLGYLNRFSIDALKIDQSFVRNLPGSPGDLVLVESIIAMAHRLGIEVVAEGVETPEQREVLTATGCDFAQGFLFARPLPVDSFEAQFLPTDGGPA
ncbi:MAG: GGDEF and EAL domain-containing protein [Myxococcales bacterium]|nr:GGDEF and EAL domain-containing protein [Myxococcales bacterium]